MCGAQRFGLRARQHKEVERYDGGIVEEDNLGYFFYDRGCTVEDVRLMVDPSTSRCPKAGAPKGLGRQMPRLWLRRLP